MRCLGVLSSLYALPHSCRNMGDSVGGGAMNTTFRGEGLSVAYDHMRIDGEEVEMSVLPVGDLYAFPGFLRSIV